MTNDLTKMSRDELRAEFLLRDNNMGNTVGVFDELARRATANERLRATLSDWCVQYGSALCPTAGSADSFGDGMRAAKDQVRRILAAAPEAPPAEKPAAPTDPERRKAIKDWSDRFGVMLQAIDDGEVSQDGIQELGNLQEDGLDLMREASAAPAPAAPVTDREAFRAAFVKAAEPLIRFLNDHPEHLHPHHTVIVTNTSAELMEGSIGHKTMEFVRD